MNSHPITRVIAKAGLVAALTIGTAGVLGAGTANAAQPTTHPVVLAAMQLADDNSDTNGGGFDPSNPGTVIFDNGSGPGTTVVDPNVGADGGVYPTRGDYLSGTNEATPDSTGTEATPSGE
jgi:hypothetical protein